MYLLSGASIGVTLRGGCCWRWPDRACSSGGASRPRRRWPGLYRGAGGEFTFWPAGPDGPAHNHDELWNTALVGDNDRMFHRVKSVGPPDAPDLRLSADSQLRHVGNGSFEIVDGDDVVAHLDVGELRISLSWKAVVFTSVDDHDRFENHDDDIDLERVHSRFIDELHASGIVIPSTSGIDDPDFVQAVNDAYPRSVPARGPDG